MSKLTIKTQLQLDGKQIDAVSERVFTDVNLIHDQGHSVQNAEKIIWSANAPGAQQDFSVLVLTTDQPVDLELVVEDLLLERGVYALPLGKNLALVLSQDEALYNYAVAADSFTGVLGKIDLLRVRESNDVPAQVRLRLYL